MEEQKPQDTSVDFTPKTPDELDADVKADSLGLDPKVRDVLKEHYGDIIGLKAEGIGVLVFRKPTRPIYTRFINKTNDRDPRKPNALAETMEEFAVSCLVFPVDGNQTPNYDLARNHFKNYPGAATTVAGDLVELAGASDKDQTAKL